MKQAAPSCKRFPSVRIGNSGKKRHLMVNRPTLKKLNALIRVARRNERQVTRTLRLNPALPKEERNRLTKLQYACRVKWHEIVNFVKSFQKQIATPPDVLSRDLSK
jgi:hypothetical protein